MLAIAIASSTSTATITECEDPTQVGKTYNLWGPLAEGRVCVVIEQDGYVLPSVDTTCSAQVVVGGKEITGKVTAVIDVNNVEIYGVRFPLEAVLEFLPPSHYIESNLMKPEAFRAACEAAQAQSEIDGDKADCTRGWGSL
jgi:hypothetical protein